MSGTSLILHAGAHVATLDEVRAVETPEATDSWCPVPHIDVVDGVMTALVNRGFTITNREFGLWRDGARFFSVLTIRNGVSQPDYDLQIGLRNSHDKSFAASGLLGSRVFVCDNLAFSGEVRFSRKHTSQFRASFPITVDRAMERLIQVRGWQEHRIDAYKATPLLSEPMVHHTIVQMLDRGAIVARQVPEVLKEWRTPSFPDFEPRTAWSLFNAVTYALKESSPTLLPERTMRLHALIDGVCGVERPSAVITDAEYEVVDEQVVDAE